MTDEKICPIMSRPIGRTNEYERDYLFEVPCLRERCMAWEFDDRDCTADFECTKYVDSGCDDNICAKCEHAKSIGYCKLIDRRD